MADPDFNWTPTDQETYDEKLEVLPPAAQSRGAFLLGCPIDAGGPDGASRFHAYHHRQGSREFFVSSRPITQSEFWARF